MDNSWDVGEMITEADAKLGDQTGASPPPPDTSLPPSEGKAQIDEGNPLEEAQIAETGERAVAPTAASEEPKQEEVADEDLKTTTNLSRVRTWGEGLERDIREKYRPVHDEVESLGGLDLVRSIASPLLREQLDGEEVLRTIEAERGKDNYETVAWAVMDRHGDWLVQRALQNPDQIKSPALRERVKSLISQPARDVNEPARAHAFEDDEPDLPDSGERDLDLLPKWAKAQILELQQLKPAVEGLKKFQQSEEERRVQKEREEQESIATTRVADLEQRAFGPMFTLVTPLKFSTEVDLQKAETENQMIREDIQQRVVREIRGNEALRAVYLDIHGKYVVEYRDAMLAGDKVKANNAARSVAEKIRDFKEKVNEVTQRHIKHFETVYGAGIKADEQIRADAGMRKVVTGTTGAAPLAPIEEKPKSGSTWDIQSAIEEANRKLG
ncbi:MAG: hypothetical protein WBV94_21775 [Blastocatellia bacterium]